MEKQSTDQLIEGGSIPTSPLQVKFISKVLAQELIIQNHYLHRKASCSWAVGLLQSEQIVGVALFGSPVSHTLCEGICGYDERLNVVELTRLWVHDKLSRNTESWFLSRALRFIPKDIIVAFADPSVGHLGIVYQACSFIYTGLGAKRKKWQPKGGTTKHFHRSFTAKTTYAVAKQQNELEYVPAIRKHRYIKFNCHGRRRKELLNKLKYPILAYVKS